MTVSSGVCEGGSAETTGDLDEVKGEFSAGSGEEWDASVGTAGGHPHTFLHLVFCLQMSLEAPFLPYRGCDKDATVSLLCITTNLLVQSITSCLSPVCVCVCVCVFLCVCV